MDNTLVCFGGRINNKIIQPLTLPSINNKIKDIKRQCIPSLNSYNEQIPDSNKQIFSNPTTPTPRNLLPVKNSKVADSSAPKSMSRAKVWTAEVENLFRFQEAGFRDFDEYIADGNLVPEIWPNGFLRCLKSKRSGCFLYFRQTRECLDKYLNKIKIYTY